MSNLGLNCDMVSCHLCDTCIYDEIIDDNMTKENTVTAKGNCCNECEFLQKLKVSTYSTTYNNLYCKKCKTKTNRLIDISVPEDKKVIRPKWCPLGNETSNETKEIKALPEPKRHISWYSLEPQVTFEEIKVGDVFHIPPYDNHKREDILITVKTDYSATYKVITRNNSVGSVCVSTLWPNTLLMKMITRHKIQNIEVAQK